MIGGRAVWRTGGRALLVVGGLLTFRPPDRLTAQVSVHLSAGARYSSTLVNDSIGADRIEAGLGIAPALSLSVGTPLEERWSVEALLDYSTSGLEPSFDGATTDLGNVGTLTFAVVVRRTIAGPLTAQAGIGGLTYLPAAERGIFRDGAGSLSPLAMLGATCALPIGGAGRRYDLAVEARYDFHRFTTPALAAEGFDGPRSVHRVAVALRAGWGPVSGAR
ncbi:MAG: hypothetical protein ACREKB_09245 [Candidatus Rokuibacteriota bacterium]